MKAKIQILCWLMSVILSSIQAFAGEIWYLKTTNDEKNLTDCTHWTNSAGVVASTFSLGDTYVAKGKSVRAQGVDVFAGGELQLISNSQLNLYGSIKFPLLTLNKSVIAQQGAHGLTYTVDGAVSVAGEGNVLRWLYSREVMNMAASLSGEKTAVLSTDVRYAADTGYGVKNHRCENLVLSGDCSGFSGKLEIKPFRLVSSVSIDKSEYFVKLILAKEDFTMPGSVTVAERCAIEVTGTSAKLGSLTLNSGSILTVPAVGAGALEIAETLTFKAPQRLRAVHSVPADGVARTTDILSAPAGVELNAEDFVLEGDLAELQFATLGVKDSDGRKTLFISYEPMVELEVSDTSSLARADANDTTEIAWGKGTSWSNGETPSDGTNYVVKMRDGKKMYLRTPTSNKDHKFPGKSLTVGTNGFLRIFQLNKKLTVSDLRLTGGSQVDVGQSTYSTLAGNISIVSGIARFGVIDKNSLSFEAVFSGGGDIWFSGVDSGSSVPYGEFRFLKDSPDFKGRIRVEYCRSDPTYKTKRQNIVAGSELQLGGRMDAFDAKALTLRKYGRLTTRNSFALTRDYNRGVFVDGEYGGVINVANESHELEFTTQLTLNGTLYKEGAGTLVMGGNVKFGADASDTPVEGANLFVVTNGTVKVTAADAMNGLAATFAAGTSLVLEVDPDNAELIEHGIKNIKTDNPFSVNGGGKLPISLYAPDEVKTAMKGRPMTIGLFTVTAKADETFRALMPETLRSPFKSTKSSIVRSEKDGTVVYSLNIVPVGFHMIVR